MVTSGRESGASLISVLVGTGILGIAIAAFASAMGNAFEGQRVLSQRTEFLALQQDLRTVLNHSRSCDSLAEQVDLEGGPQNVVVRNAAGAVVAEAGTKRPGLELTSVKVTPTVDDEGVAQLDLHIVAKKVKGPAEVEGYKGKTQYEDHLYANVVKNEDDVVVCIFGSTGAYSIVDMQSFRLKSTRSPRQVGLVVRTSTAFVGACPDATYQCFTRPACSGKGGCTQRFTGPGHDLVAKGNKWSLSLAGNSGGQHSNGMTGELMVCGWLYVTIQNLTRGTTVLDRQPLGNHCNGQSTITRTVFVEGIRPGDSYRVTGALGMTQWPLGVITPSGSVGTGGFTVQLQQLLARD